MAPPVCPVASLLGPVLPDQYGDGCGRGRAQEEGEPVHPR